MPVPWCLCRSDDWTSGARRGQDRRVRILPAATFLTILLAGCASRPVAAPSAPRAVREGDTFTLLIGESVRIGAKSFVLRFDAVAEDSRCPKGGTCVWEGNARAVFSLLDPSPGAVQLNTSGRFERHAPVPGGTLELKSLLPSPPIDDPKKYVATLRFEARQ